MAILDASAGVEYLLATPPGQLVDLRLRRASVVRAPHVIDLEIASSLRRQVAAGSVERAEASEALRQLAELPLRRYPATLLLRRIWELRHTHTVYEASYVALAEALEEPLLTLDARLARSHGHRATIELVRP